MPVRSLVAAWIASAVLAIFPADAASTARARALFAEGDVESISNDPRVKSVYLGEGTPHG